jgi:heme oxygenase
MTKPNRSELHDQLRQAAKAPHRLVDHHPLLAPLIRSELTEKQYGDALAALQDPNLSPPDEIQGRPSV